MCKFIEVSNPKGETILVNTSAIISVSDVSANWGVEFAGERQFKYVPSSCIVVTKDESVLDDWYVLETYDQIKAMLI